MLYSTDGQFASILKPKQISQTGFRIFQNVFYDAEEDRNQQKKSDFIWNKPKHLKPYLKTKRIFWKPPEYYKRAIQAHKSRKTRLYFIIVVFDSTRNTKCSGALCLYAIKLHQHHPLPSPIVVRGFIWVSGLLDSEHYQRPCSILIYSRDLIRLRWRKSSEK